MFAQPLSIKEFTPGNRFELEAESGIGSSVPKLLITLFLTPFWLGPMLPMLFAAFGQFGSSGGAADTGGKIAVVGGMVCFGLVWYSILTLFTYLAGLAVGNWTHFALSNRSQEVQMRFNGTFIWFSSETTVSFRDIEHITVKSSGEGEAEVELSADITYRTEEGETDTVSPSFRVRHVDLIEETIALACAVGDIAGMRFYQVTRRDHLTTSIRLAPDRSGLEEEGVTEAQPIPDVTTDLNFKEDVHAQSEGEASRTDLSFEEPEVDLPPFDPESFREHASTRTPSFEWDPGNQVVIDVPPNPVWSMALISLVFGVVAWVISGFFAWGLIEPALAYTGYTPGWWTGTVAIGGLVAVGVFTGFTLLNKARKTSINWQTGQLELDIGNRTVTGTIDDVRSLIVEGRRWSGDDDSPPKYECTVYLDLPDGREQMLSTWRDTDEETVYQHAGSLAEDLAEALDVDWTWKGFE